ncbi:MAG: penicillin-binding protein 2 [Candidatus Nanopelagicales bacterium]
MSRLFILRVLTVSMFLTLIGRLFFMQMVIGNTYAQQASNNQLRAVVVPAPRGLILDQAGRVLTGNQSSLVVTVDRTAITSHPAAGLTTLSKLAAILKTPVAELQARLTLCGTPGAAPSPICWNGSPFQPIPVAKGVGTDIALQVLERRSELPGVQAELQSEREFPKVFGVNLAQVLGYLGPVSDAEIAADSAKGLKLKRTDVVGRSGLEQSYDLQLRGTPGVTELAVDRNSTVIGTVSKTDPVPGNYLVTNIDARLQAVVEKQLAAAIARARQQGFPGDSGAAVVVDVNNGKVLAMASYPTYDPSVWVGGISSKDYQALTDKQSGTPLLFRPTQALFPPASTFKAISTVAAGNAGYPLTAPIACPSDIKLGNLLMHNHESAAYGNISVQRAIEVSCNTVFYKIGYDLWLRDGGNKAKNPKDPISTTAKAFGLGSPTGIDLPGEASGRVGGRQFKTEQYAQFREIWCRRSQIGYPEVSKTDPVRGAYLTALAKENCIDGWLYRGGDAANTAIGQGDTAVTPLQMAMVYAAIANGGTVWEPQIAKAFISSDGRTVTTIKPKAKAHVFIKKAVRDYLINALQGVPLRGTGIYPFQGFPLDKIKVAAKTGSGEVSNAKAPVSWFNAFAPADHPKYEVVVMVSQGGTGAVTSGPSVRMIMEALFGVQGSTVNPAKSVLVGSAPATRLPTVRADGTVVPLPGAGQAWSPLAKQKAGVKR